MLAESCAIAVVGGGLGLMVAWLIAMRGDPTGGLLPAFFLPARDLTLGALMTLVLGFISGIMPAVQAMRLRIVDALRRN